MNKYIIHALIVLCAICGTLQAKEVKDLKVWSAKFFSDYKGFYTLLHTDGICETLIITPFENKQGNQFLSVLKIKSVDFSSQPTYHHLGDFDADTNKGILSSANFEKWKMIKFKHPTNGVVSYGINIDGIIYIRALKELSHGGVVGIRNVEPKTQERGPNKMNNSTKAPGKPRAKK